MLVAPSILALKRDQWLEGINLLNQTEADLIHLDIMDGIFVNNKTFDYQEVAWFKNHTKIPLDVHLMITDPFIEIIKYLESGADYLTFHYEAEENFLKVYQQIKKINPVVKVGISIKPQTSVEVLASFLPLVDLILVMSVEPGFGGQKFMISAIDKLKWLKQQKLDNNYHYLISVDGGINDQTYQLVKDYTDIVVSGSYLFQKPNLQKAIYEMKGKSIKC